MTSKKIKGYYIFAIVGFILFMIGIVLTILFSESQGIMRTLPFSCIGIGAGLGGGGLGGVIRSRQMLKDPQLVKQIDIDTKDERNIAINNKARSATFNFTLFILSGLVIFLSLMQVETYITLVFVGAYLLIIFVYIYFLKKYHKEM